MKRMSCIVVIISCFYLQGCGNTDPYQRSTLSGKISLDGEPIGSGEVILIPDPARGNSGPSVVAPISHGTYQSTAENGPVSGPTTVRIMGYSEKTDPKATDGSLRLLIDSYETSIEIPAGKATFDFELTRNDLEKK